MTHPHSDCRTCSSFAAPAWCSAMEEQLVRLVGRCSSYEGPPLEDAEPEEEATP